MKPTVGRVMLYRNPDGLLNASIVAFVHNDEGTLVNLSVIDASGVAAPRTSVQVFDGPQDDIPVSMCGWMDYQRGVASAQASIKPPSGESVGLGGRSGVDNNSDAVGSGPDEPAGGSPNSQS